MSLFALPSELDAHIIAHCDFKSRLALCAVSIYWRTLAEPHLYPNLCFATDEHQRLRLLMLTLLKRPGLAKYIKSFQVVPPIAAEKSDLNLNDTPFNGIVYVTKSNLEDDLVKEPIEEKARRERRELEIRRECRVLLPKIQQIIESAWPHLHPRLVLGTWLGHMVESIHSLDYSLALIFTLATNLEDLEIRVPSYSNIAQVYMLLQYHRTIEEVASGRAYPFCKLRNLVKWSANFPEDLIGRIISWIPLPVNVETYRLFDFHIDHFEYPVLKEDQTNPRLRLLEDNFYFPTISQMSPGFTPTIRVLELSRCNVNTMCALEVLVSGYFRHLEVLRLNKLGLYTDQHIDDYIDWPNFGCFLNKSLPKLRNLQLSICWIESVLGAIESPEDLGEPAGALKEIVNLNHLAMDLGLLIPSFASNACDKFLELPTTMLLQRLHCFAITNVNLEFLDLVEAEYTGAERRNVFGQLVTALTHCYQFTVETYQRPTDHTIETLKLIGADLGKMGVELALWCQGDEEPNKNHRLI